MPVTQPVGALRTFATGTITDQAFSADGTKLYLSIGNTITSYDVATGSVLDSFNVGTKVGGIDLSADGKYLVTVETGSGASNIYRVDLASHAVQTVANGVGPFYDASFLKDGTVLASSSSFGAGVVVNFDTGATVRTVGFSAAKTSLIATADKSAVIGVGFVIGDLPVSRYSTDTGTVTTYHQTFDPYAGASPNFLSYAGIEAIAPDGSAIVGPRLFDGGLGLKLANAFPAIPKAVAVAYSPTGDTAYVYAYNALIAFHTTDWSPAAVYSLTITAPRADQISGTNSFSPYGNDVTVSHDGRYVSVIGNNVMQIVDLHTAVNEAGTAGNDTLTGTVLFGLGGDDTLTAVQTTVVGGITVPTSDPGVLVGGPGDDAYYVAGNAANVFENPGEGYDTVFSSQNYALTANVEKLVLTGAAYSGAGNDIDNLILGNDNDNLLTGAGGNDTLYGYAGNDRLDGGTGADVMVGGVGDDTYSVDSPNDTIVENANEGQDTLYASTSYVLAAGVSVETLIVNGSGAINLTGNDLGVTLIGNSAANVLTGGAGNDTLTGNGGADTLIGGSGDDTYNVIDGNTTIVEAAGGGTDLVRSTVSFTLGDNVENLTLVAAVGDGNGTGNALANVITGGFGANMLFGMAGNDTLYGLGGDDTLDGGTGDDRMIGGTGNDTYFVDSAGDVVVENANEGIDTIISTVGYVLPDNVENLTLSGSANINATGNALANVIVGNGGNNFIDGGAGNDAINGGAGNDTIQGGEGNDIIDGGDGNDTISDTGGSDTIRGGAGDDTIYISRLNNIASETVKIDAGSGNDVVNYSSNRAGSATIDLGDGNDRLTISTTSNSTITVTLGAGLDTISFSGPITGDSNLVITDFTGRSAGAAGDKFDLTDLLNFSLLGWNGSTNPFGTAGYLRLVQSGNDTILQIDRDGAAGTAQSWTQLATLKNVTAAFMTAADFGGWQPSGTEVSGQTINGTPNSDTLTGTQGADQIFGLGGDDTIDGGAGADRIDGGDGNDFIQGGAGDDIIDGGDGNDFIQDTSGSDTIRGGAGNDTISISRGLTDNITETLSIDAGSGNDIVNYNNVRPGSVTIDLGDGNDHLTTFVSPSGLQTITLGSGQDILSVIGGYDPSNNIVVTDFAVGAAGDQLDLIDYLRPLLSGWDRSSNPFSSGGYLRLVQVGSDTVVQIDKDGAAGNASGWTSLLKLQNVAASQLTAFNFGGWQPKVAASASVDAAYTIREGAGAQTIDITLKNVGAYTGTVTTSIDPNGSTATAADISGLAGVYNYSVTQTPANDYVLHLPFTAVTDDVAEGSETLKITITASGQIFDNGTDTTSVLVTILDNGWGSSGNDTLTGGAGNDVLFGFAGNDVLNGLGGDDKLMPGSGRDIVDGGDGTDTLVLSGNRASYSVFTIAGKTYLVGASDGVLAANVEKVQFADGTASWQSVMATAMPFDATKYTAANSDLKSMDAAAATAHFAQFGFLEGRAAGNFNALEYIASNGDLIKAFGTNTAAATAHYQQFGLAEHRQTASFDALKYIASYADLIKAFGTDTTAATAHYITFGANEGRTATFNATEYLASNPDLIKALGDDSVAAELHYLTSGFNEHRVLDSFNALAYAASNTDLAKAFGTDQLAAEHHYLNSGFVEGRATSGFDAIAYELSNQDLGKAGLTPDQALMHWLTNGAKEGRAGDSLYGREQTNHIASANGTTHDTLGTTTDHDWFQVALTAGQKIDLGVQTATFDPLLQIFDSHGVLQQQAQGATTGATASAAFTASAAGVYYIGIAATDAHQGDYDLIIHPHTGG